MSSIQTTGGLFTEKIRLHILNNISNVFDCQPEDIEELEPLQAGLTNIVLSFKYNGGRFVYRHPGLGSETLVDRGRETIMQKVVQDIGVDTTLVAMDVEGGWKITRFVEHRSFDYHNLNDMVRGIMLLRKLHEGPCRVRWNFDIMEVAARIKSQIEDKDYGNFPNFDEVTKRCKKLYELTKLDGVKKCNVHGDARDDNFLINDKEIYLIDWEFGGYSDPGFDIGSYVNGGDHTVEDVDRILFTYYRRTPTPTQRRHFYAYIALTGWFYLHWVMLKESKGQEVGYLKRSWLRYSTDFSVLALDMYKEQGVDVTL